jgi:hypothetical protein
MSFIAERLTLQHVSGHIRSGLLRYTKNGPVSVRSQHVSGHWRSRRRWLGKTKGVEMNVQLELMNKNISMLQAEIKYLQTKIQESRHVGDQEKHSQLLEQQSSAAYYLEHAIGKKAKIIMNTNKT